MTEETLFAEAIEKSTPAERTAFLDAACGGDAALRQRVEALLQSHAREDFLKTPAIQRAAEDAGGNRSAGATAGEVHGDDSESALDFLVPSEKPDSLGRLGHYEVQEIIGRGGMGVVLRAFDEKLHRVVAIKVMAAQLATNGTARKRFTREAQAQAAVSHDHIVTIHAVEEANGLPYLVMQYISGMSLQERLDKSGPLQLHEILRIGMQAAAGLAAAHAQGLVHRDIKPANILLENGVERVKITDFGLARAATEASLTQSGVVAGTPQYMSPEQAEGKAIDQRTDLFSLGSVLYAMCTGRAPFRASGTMAVLKRVCEETPTPIRETNPDVPDWLVAIIDKLHAKDAAQRFQSAAEVAELLGRHLARVQHPSVVGQVATTSTPKAESRPFRRRQLAFAAAVLLCLIAGFSFTEATGVTNVRGTVIRIFTPDGTLVVETDDPGVKVTVEGDGGLIITVAGLEEIRLRPGSYKVHADKDGKRVPLDRELVSIAKNGREVVRVKLVAAAVQPARQAEKSAFVLLGGRGLAESKFDTLDAAVLAARSGGTIEIRGNGPFVSDGVTVNRPIVIRAGEGFAPLIRLSDAQASRNTRLIAASASLVLEGLDLRVKGQAWGKVEGRWPTLLSAHGGARLHVVNCRLVTDQLPITSGAAVCSLRNCQVLSSSRAGVDWYAQPGGRCNIANSVIAVGGLSLNLRNPDLSDIAMTLRDSTIVGHGLSVWRRPDLLAEPNSPPLVRWDFSGNVVLCAPVFDRFATLYFEEGNENALAPGEAEALIRRLIDLREQRNVYPRSVPMLQLRVDKTRREGARGQDLADWDRFWGHEKTDSVEGDIRFQGGDLVFRAHTAPEGLTAEDFRLRPDSAGSRAGKDGNDLGAEVDLVGPGPAYERWKKTPDYQQWIKETGQLRPEAPELEPGAFVILGTKEIAERKFDTLAAAVRGASDGDTIEIRGNGPFISRPIVIGQQAITIRAGAGFWPVIRADSDEAGDVLLHSEGLLTLEGLDFQWVNAKPGGPGRYLVVSNGATARLLAVNCRFLMNRREGNHSMGCISTRDSALCHLRNCQLLVSGHGSFYPPFAVRGGPDSTLIVENCLVGQEVIVSVSHAKPMKAILKHNTFLGERFLTFRHQNQVGVANTKPGAEPFEVMASENIFGGPLLFVHIQAILKSEMTIGGKEVEQALRNSVGWRDDGNLYWSPEGSELLRLFLEKGLDKRTRLPLTTPITTLSAWKDFWDIEKLDSKRGQAKFEGGSLIARAKLEPESLTPEDFRLRPDSAGYRVGKDGKDLGADVNLVGPSAAYERWKKTPDYQLWLKDTGQLRAEALKSERGAFVLVGGNRVAERKFNTLNEAVLGASDGDAIEVRGNGPFVSDGVTIRHRLVIRAGENYTPSITLNHVAADKNIPLLTVSAQLVLEGLELRRTGGAGDDVNGRVPKLIDAWHPSLLHIANCRLTFNADPLFRRRGNLIGTRATRMTVRNCELYGNVEFAGQWHYAAGGRFAIENCVIDSGAFGFHNYGPDFKGVSIGVHRSTVVGHCLDMTLLNNPGLPDAAESVPPVRLELSGNVSLWDATTRGFLFFHLSKHKAPVAPAQAEGLLARLVRLDEKRNVYRPGTPMLRLALDWQPLKGKRGQDLADWDRFWSQKNTGSVEGDVRFQGGDLISRARSAPDQLTAEDFRLRSDSAGYRAGKDGKNLGADVDLVGPGPAYERWKKTPEYQQWLKDTGQVKNVKATELTPEQVRERQAVEVLLRKGASVSLTSADFKSYDLEKPGQAWPAGAWHVHVVRASRLPALTRADLAALRDFPRLRALTLTGSPVTTAAVLDQIEGRGVAELRLTEVPTTSKDVARIAKIKTLTTLFLYGTGMSDDDIAQLADLPLLNDVNVGGNKITDESLKHLARLPLRRLFVSRTKVTDVGLALLHPCKNLVFLNVDGTGVTAEGAASLRMALPKCEIVWGKDAGKGN